MSLLAELKRRNVIRMAGLYLVGAWLIVQVAGTVLPMFGAPAWVPRTIVIVLAIGFLPALAFAWVFELTPTGLMWDEEVPPEQSIAPQTARRMERMTIVVLVLALGYFAIDKYLLAPRRTQAQVATPVASAAPAAAENSIAVLPFVNMSADPEQTYFSDGLSEDLITALSQSGHLRVIARDFSFRFRGHTGDSRAIGAQLGVAHLLSGSVRRVGDVVRISADLVNAADGSTLWSQHFDRPYRDLFKLQDEITAEVATALKARMQGNAHALVQSDRPASGNLAAFTAWLESTSHGATLEGQPAAIADLDRAIALDPGYAQAYASRAFKRTFLAGHYGSEDSKSSETYARARADALHALALYPGLAIGHDALGIVALNANLDVHAAESEFRQAVQLAPGDPRGWNNLASALSMLGRQDESVAARQHALRLDPLSPDTYAGIGVIELARGRLDASEEAFRHAIALQPKNAFYYVYLCRVAVRRGDAAAAMRAAVQAPPGLWRELSTAMAAQIGADRAAADAMLAAFVQQHASESAFHIAVLYALRKDPGQAIAWLERARGQRDPSLVDLLLNPYLLDYRKDPRLVAFSESVGLPLAGLQVSKAGQGTGR